MFLFLSKSLPLLIYPLGLACLLLLVALLLRQRRWQRILTLISLLILWLGSNAWVATFLVASLERQYQPLDAIPKAPVIVVLGGGTRSPSYPRRLAEVNEAGDRLLYASWLYHQGAAPAILVSGGGIEWLSGPQSETASMSQLLQFLGIPENAIWLEPLSRNTYENARFSRDILQSKNIRRIILVTSALHMPRSVHLFEAQGFEVIPAPSDYLITQTDWTNLYRPDLRTQLIHLLPDPYYLYINSLALKEYMGALVYGLRGWL